MKRRSFPESMASAVSGTIAIFSPIMVFIRVDLPTLGRPTMLTNPDFNDINPPVSTS
jgi:hypothetical protein